MITSAPSQVQLLAFAFADPTRYCQAFGSIRLRSYQQDVARAVVRSVLGGLGHSLVVMFPRQSGKNELQAQLEAYLLSLFCERGAEMVKLSPTYQPQCLNAMRRLERALNANQLTRGRWQKKAGNLYRLGLASQLFLSAAPEANIVGATAATLLQVDEAQDVGIDKFDKEIAPMAASTNATRVFWGTAWTNETLLARELRLAEAAQACDGIQRVFRLSADAVCQEVPAYGAFVAEQVRRMGRQHPFVRSQYYSEEIDAGGGLFTAARLAMMQGAHPAQLSPKPGAIYAMLLDLAGEDEAMREGSGAVLANPGRDASALTVVEVSLDGAADDLLRKPSYRVVWRATWVGEKHAASYARVRALAEHWQVRWLVVDASGVGAGLASFLADALGERVLPVVFSSQVKSRLGWGFLAAVDSGRFKDYACLDAEQGELASLHRLFFQQLAAVQYSVRPGPEKLLSWSVPEGARDPASGALLHDDLVLSAALVSILDQQTWSAGKAALMVPAGDPLRDMERGF